VGNIVSLFNYVFEIDELFLNLNGSDVLKIEFGILLRDNVSEMIAIAKFIDKFGKDKVKFLWKQTPVSYGV
jgi:hypothetical protein